MSHDDMLYPGQWAVKRRRGLLALATQKTGDLPKQATGLVD